MTFVPMMCPNMPTKGLQRIKAKFQACPSPEVCKQRGCLKEIENFTKPRPIKDDGVIR